MFINLIKYCDSKSINIFDFIPPTIILKINTKNNDQNFKNFKLLFSNLNKYLEGNENNQNSYSELFTLCLRNKENLKNTKITISRSLYDEKNLWIIKPEDLCGGRCIKVFDNLNDMEEYLKKFSNGISKSIKNDLNYQNSKNSENDEDDEDIEESEDEKKISKITPMYRSNLVLLQKYIERPLLYKGRKFDIRIWVLLNQNLDIFMFKEGHLKTASLDYNINTKDKFVHITNYSLQKYNGNFNKFEFGNEVSFEDFQNSLDTEYPERNINIQKDLFPKMINIINITVDSIKDKINRKNRYYCYVVLGYDFMIDIDFKVWLLEINKNPGLSESSPLINSLLPRMLDDSFRLTVDQVFEPNYYNNDTKNYKSPFSVKGYSDNENMWMKINDKS